MTTLEQIARACLLPKSSALLLQHLQVAPAIFGFWVTWYKATPELVLIAFARAVAIFPSAKPYAVRCLTREVLHLQRMETAETTILIELLVAFWRLLRHAPTTFQEVVSLHTLWPLLKHEQATVRYLAISVLSYALDMAQSTLQRTIDQSVGEESTTISLEEGSAFDLRVFDAEESLRIRTSIQVLNTSEQSQLIGREAEFPDNVVQVAGILLPCFAPGRKYASRVVPTPVSTANLHKLAAAAARSDAVLVQGPSGSGKTFMIEDLARSMSRKRDLVRIHLGDQTDVKLLLGTYITSDTPGHFVWQAGILANAVTQGKWLLVEDIDKAPSDVLSILMPLLESRRLFIASRDETILARSDFRVFATRTTRASSHWTPNNLMGGRLWTTIDLELAPNSELAEIVSSKYPILANLRSSIIQVYEAVKDLSTSSTRYKDKSFGGRLIGTLDLLKWCRRICALFSTNGITQADQPIVETLEHDIFCEAVDCFASSVQSLEGKRQVTEVIGRNLGLPPERVRLYIESHCPELIYGDALLQVGRAVLAHVVVQKRSRRPFALTRHALRLLEQLMVAIRLSEPLLLVGETGTGKTTIIQYLAEMTGHRLVAINMSQQTESGDLLGGFKPIDPQMMAFSLLETFEILFAQTLSSRKNTAFVNKLRKTYRKSNWTQMTILLKEAVKIAQTTLSKIERTDTTTAEASHRKKRKLDSDLSRAWKDFSTSLDAFHSQQSQKSRSFAFSFVEGSLIKAVKRGDWVLLDEINLAAPDTLESINGLLQEDGTILLTERGDTQAIVPHPNFRLFSCMNPATDVGKKDLPIGVRSRFTEIYVQSPDSDEQDLLAIIRQYIGGLCLGDSRACGDVAHLYAITKQLAADNRLVDGSNQRPHYSIRTLTRTLSFVVDICPIYGLRRSLYEGFCMSYLTLLNQDSEIVLRPIIEEHTLLRARGAKSQLGQVPKRPDTGEWIQFHHYWLPKGPMTPLEDAFYIMTPFVEKNMLNLVRAASTKKYPILLQGPTSSGKTSMVEHLAKRTGHGFVRINNHEHTDLQEYLGSYMSDSEGNLSFQEGILVQAVRLGHWLVLDELNLAPTDVLEALNRLLDDNRELLIPETQEVVKPHPNFILFATQNPPGLYGGRKHLSRAFRNRFLELHFEDIPINELEDILWQRCQIPPTYCKRIVEVYKELSVRRQSSRVFEQKNSFATLRDLFRWATRPATGYDQLAVNGYILLAERVRKADEKLIVREVIEKIMHVKLSAIDVYDVAGLEEYKALKKTGLDGSIVWTRAFRRLFFLLASAFRNNEPVLLVGETGCGKTAVCQLIAEALSRPISILNAHQNTETADLIGAQRPIRTKLQDSALLSLDLQAFLNGYDSSKGRTTDLNVLEEELSSLNIEEHTGVSNFASEVSTFSERIAQSRALFQWSDGPLVQAMKSGEIFLLDEISLAEDAVLERLNSVLETGRTLVMAEKGTQDTAVVGSPKYQFCATMNPGGDFGKKELSPALRNRFTEIWVPAMTDDEDVLQILQATLHESRQSITQKMLSFALFFSSSFSSALTSTSVSIRDLLSWAEFCNRIDLDINESFVQGAALVYIDSLGATKTRHDSSETDVLQEQRSLCLAELSKISGYDCAKFYNQQYVLSVGTVSVSIGSYSVMKGTNPSGQRSFEFEAPTTLLNATRVFRAMQLPKPILLEGSPGVGKTSLISAIAELACRRLVRINFSDQTDLIDLFGSDAPVEDNTGIAFAWRDAPFLRAMQNGDWVLLDEMNLASQSILEGLNACLDHRGQAFVPELNRTFYKHPDFRVFAAQNPHSQGGGRKGLPKSFINRFTVVYCDPLSSHDIHKICMKHFVELNGQTITNVVDLALRTQKEANTSRGLGHSGASWEFNLRDVMRWLSILQERKEQAFAAYYANFMLRQRFRTSLDRDFVDDLIQQTFGTNATYRPAFASISDTEISVGRTTLSRGDSFMDAQTKYYPIRCCFREAAESIFLCIAKAWPCILVGSSGAGKSCLLQGVSTLLGQTLRTISANSDMDASDLLGGFEQRDINRGVIRVKSKCISYFQKLLRENLSFAGYQEVLQIFERLQHGTCDEGLLKDLEQTLLSYSPDSFETLQEVIDFRKALSHGTPGHFEWKDGGLLRAVRDGEWLVLDNANLCDPSVLDRLNSLLEDGGQLVVNERIMYNGAPMVVKPHKNFRIFMTLDPQHGELSRAMRNRGMEIYLPCNSDYTTFLNSRDPTSSFWSSISQSLWDMETPSETNASTYLAEAITRYAPAGFRIYQLSNPPQLWTAVMSDLAQIRLAPEMNLLKATTSPAQLDMLSFSALQSNNIINDTVDRAFHKLELSFLIKNLRQEWAQAVNYLLVAVSKTAVRDVKILSEVCNLLLGSTLENLTELSQKGNSPSARILLRLNYLVEHCETVGLESLISSLQHFRRFADDTKASGLAAEISSILSQSAYLLPMKSGTSMQILWAALRSDLPGNELAIRQYETIEKALRRLDQTFMEKRMTSPEAIELKMKYVRTLKWISCSVPRECTASHELDQFDRTDVMSFRFSNKSELSSIFLYIYSKVKMQQVAQFGSWQIAENPALIDLASLNTLSNAQSTELIDFMASVPGSIQSVAARLSALSCIAVRHLGFDATENGRQPGHSCFTTFQAHWRAVVTSTEKLVLGGVDGSLQELSEIGYHTTRQSQAILRPEIQHLVWLLLGRLQSIVNCLQPTSSNAPVSPTRSAPRQDYSLPPTIPAGLENDIRVLDISTNAKDCLLRCLEHFTRCNNANEGDFSHRGKQLASAWINYSRALVLLYIPNIPKDPGSEALTTADFCAWVLTRATNRTDAHIAISKAIAGGIENPVTDMLRQQIETAHEGIANAPKPTLYRPKVSLLYQIQSEFDYCLSLFAESGSLEQLLDSLAKSEQSSHAQAQNMLANLSRLDTRLQAFQGYRDVLSPVLDATSALRVGINLFLRYKTEINSAQNQSKIIAFPDPIALLTPSAMIRKDFMSFKCAILWQLRGMLFHVSQFGVTTNTIDLFTRVSQDMFEQWFINRERDIASQAQETSVYKYSAPEEPASEDYREMFPDYEGPDSKMTLESSDNHLDASIFELQELILNSAEESSPLADVTIIRTIDDMLDTQQDGEAFKTSENARGGQLAMTVYHASRRRDHLTVGTSPEDGSFYDFYRSPNILETRKIVPMLHQLRNKVTDLILAWPENSTLIELQEGLQRLLDLPLVVSVAQTLTMLEQTFAVLAQWQEVASREFSVAHHFDEIRNRIIEWRRFELSCWPRLFDLEEAAVIKSDSKIWYNLYEVIIFASEKLEGGQDHDFTARTVDLLLQFMQSATSGQFTRRLKYLKTFIQFVSLSWKADDHLASFTHAIHHVYRYFSAFEDSVKAFLRQERKVLAKEVNQVIKLASWKDTNVFALRESSRRSHRALYKIIHKFRRVLLTPAQQTLIKGLISSKMSSNSQSGPCIAQNMYFLQRLESSQTSDWPARYRFTERTASKIESVKRDLAEQHTENHLKTFVDNAIDSMQQLRAETPVTFDVAKLGLIKHLKNRKRKLLSDSLKTLKNLGLRSVIKPDDLERQRVVTHLFLNVPPLSTTGISAANDEYFYRLIDLLPQIRAGYANHAEDVTSSEVKRGTGYFDSLFLSMLHERASLADFAGFRQRLDKVLSSYWTITAQKAAMPNLAVGLGSKRLMTARLDREKEYVALFQLLEVTKAWHEAHVSFADRGNESLMKQNWWVDLLKQIEQKINQPDRIRGNAIFPSASTYIYLQEYENVITHVLHTITQKQVEDTETAYVFDTLVDWLRQRMPRPHSEEEYAQQIPVELHTFAERLQSVCDQILRAVQGLRTLLQEHTTYVEDAWFAKTTANYRSQLQKLTQAGIPQQLESLLEDLKTKSFAGSCESLLSVAAHFGPILQAYSGLCAILQQRFEVFHQSSSRCTLLIGQTLNTLATDGFCSPAPPDPATTSETQNTSEGTGLGTGEGDENITKDVEDDEDIGDLEGADDAANKDEREDQIEAKEVEDDMAGDLEDVSNDGSLDSDGSEAGDTEDVDDEIGEVDDQNETALDEKMWDDEHDDLRNKETEKKNEEQGPDDETQDIDMVNKTEDEKQEPNNTSAEVPQDSVDQADTHDEDEEPEPLDDESAMQDNEDKSMLDEAHNLDLPQDLDIDHQSKEEGEGEGEEEGEEEEKMSEDDDATSVERNDAVDTLSDEDEADAEARDHEKDGSDMEGTPETEATGPREPEKEEDGAENAENVPEQETLSQDLVATEQDLDSHELENSENGDGHERGMGHSQAQDQAGEDHLDEPQSEHKEKEKATENLAQESATENNNGLDENQTTGGSDNFDKRGDETIRTLGDALEQFRRLLHINEAPEVVPDAANNTDSRDNDQYEHVAEKQQQDAQAMGPSHSDEVEGTTQSEDINMPDVEDNTRVPDPTELPVGSHTQEADDQQDSGVGDEMSTEIQRSALDALHESRKSSHLADVEMESDSEGTEVTLSQAPMIDGISLAPQDLWRKHERDTHDLATGLCEQLRLILEPTVATKMRGDFRTGKRLNMRRIIPYIASQFKKDKIWMRRSVPSKRQYQVMLAIDDSKSMAESSSIHLAFDTVALVSTALSVLEVGQMSVVKFGAQPQIVHEFQDQFSSESGPKIFDSFAFDQTKTDIKALTRQTLEIFRKARASQHGSGAELWQLQFIISDGICEDHESIRRILRQAREERVMVVFLIIDTIHGAKQHSILQMKQAKYITQQDGSKKLQFMHYMEEFAFENFLIIQDVSELPHLLCSTLRQFFAATQ